MESCPCGSGSSLSQCCGPFLDGSASPQTAEQLLRSRYSAFTLHDVDYVIRTHHSKTRGAVDPEETERWARDSTWLGLKVIETVDGGPDDSRGTVDFVAHYTDPDGTDVEHREHATFEREDGQWRFLDAREIKQEPIRRSEPKVGRNEPCPCGSGKKFKRCCAAAA